MKFGACCALLLLALAVSSNAAELKRHYAFDDGNFFADSGADGEDISIFGAFHDFSNPSSHGGCKTGHGGCLVIDQTRNGSGLWPSMDVDPTLGTCTSNNCFGCCKDHASIAINEHYSNGFSICYWMKSFDVLSGWENLMSIYDPNAQATTQRTSWPYGNVFRVYDNSGYFEMFSTGLDISGLGSRPQNTRGQWEHQCWIFEADGDVCLYHDGQAVWCDTSANQVVTSGKKVTFGWMAPEAGTGGNYLFDDVKIYDGPLNSGEIASLMAEDDASRPSAEDPNVCNAADIESCQDYSSCSKSAGNVTCSCWNGFDTINSECVNVKECEIDSKVAMCHSLAYCDDTIGSYECTCPEGFLGDGFACTSDSWGVRAVCEFPNASLVDIEALKLGYARAVTGDYFQDGDYDIFQNSSIVETAHVEAHATGTLLTINALFYTEAEASTAINQQMDQNFTWSSLQGCTLIDGPDVYRWTGKSTNGPIEVGPSGVTIDSVSFRPACLGSGCWVVDVTYTTGTDDFNAFYLPFAVGSDQLSYDFDYTGKDATWTTQSPADTFFPNTHPCTSADYDAADGLLAQVSSCCLDQFLAMYRPISSFETAVSGKTGGNCGVGARDRALNSSAGDVYQFALKELPGDTNAPEGVYVSGTFKNMTSYGEPRGVVDPYVGIYKARFYLDEVELRTLAGQLRGTVGVEHTVDTFLGLINLSPTGTSVLDTFATQAALHLEKTSFFLGVNTWRQRLHLPPLRQHAPCIDLQAGQ